MNVLEVRRLYVSHRVGRTRRVVLQDVDLSVPEGGVVGLVGESGSGKTTLAHAVMGLLQVDSGRILVDGQDIVGLSGRRLRRLRRKFQIVFQDPRSSLDPRWPVARSISEPLGALVPELRAEARQRRVEELLRLVGLDPRLGVRLPGELSGGQLQRVAIARALAPGPRLLVADEPTSALDVSVQAQVVNLLGRLQRTQGLAMLFVSHDIRLVGLVSHRIDVLFAGRIVERGRPRDVTARPLHPYTKLLMAAVPEVSRHKGGNQSSRPDRVVQGSGCPFAPSCPTTPKPRACREVAPRLEEVRPGHWVACHVAGRGSDQD